MSEGEEYFCVDPDWKAAKGNTPEQAYENYKAMTDDYPLEELEFFKGSQIEVRVETKATIVEV